MARVGRLGDLQHVKLRMSAPWRRKQDSLGCTRRGGGRVPPPGTSGWRCGGGRHCASRPPEGRRVGLLFPSFLSCPGRADWQLGAAPGTDSWADLALLEGQANTSRCCMADAYYHDRHAKDLLWRPNLPLHLGTRGPFSHLSQETKTYLWVCNHTSGNLGKYPLNMSRPGI